VSLGGLLVQPIVVIPIRNTANALPGVDLQFFKQRRWSS
jgi:hypothetical protein